MKSAAIIAVMVNHVEDRQDWPHADVIMTNDKNLGFGVKVVDKILEVESCLADRKACDEENPEH